MIVLTHGRRYRYVLYTGKFDHFSKIDPKSRNLECPIHPGCHFSKSAHQNSSE